MENLSVLIDSEINIMKMILIFMVNRWWLWHMNDFLSWLSICLILKLLIFIGRNRWVIYSDRFGYDYDASHVDPQWYGWLHYKTDTLPYEVCNDAITFFFYKISRIMSSFLFFKGWNFIQVPDLILNIPAHSSSSNFISMIYNYFHFYLNELLIW